MRIAVVADIHANFTALEAVLRHAEAGGPVDAIWSLGDLVGYGPDPGACIALLRSYRHVAVAGNHDRAAAGHLGVEEFNPYAALAVIWTSRQLKPDERDFLSFLPLPAVEGDFTLVHGSLRDPVWEYVHSAEVAAAHLERQTTPYGFVGHTHVPLVFSASGSIAQGYPQTDGSVVALDATHFVANPGSVGQPRDGDPRSAYALLDTGAGAITFHRVEYDIARTQARMRDAELPGYLIERLARGR